jgi:SEC-C motif-containing protein
MAGCPCGLPSSYDLCCGRFHRGEATPPTAEALMRSRYSAFAIGDAGYLLATWHPSTRPRSVETGSGWLRLEVLEAAGGLLDIEGTVRFRASARDGVVEERSRFLRDGGRWSYLGPVPG